MMSGFNYSTIPRPDEQLQSAPTAIPEYYLIRSTEDDSLSLKIFTSSGHVSIFIDSRDSMTDKVLPDLGLPTGRNLDEIEVDAPGLLPLLSEATGKIIFLGNGFSEYPLMVARRFASGEVNDIPIIVDLFDYKEVKKLLEQAIPLLQELGFGPPECLARFQKINAAIDAGHLISVRYCVGKPHQEIPTTLIESDLVVNVFGPSSVFLAQQIAMLRLGGKLYFTHCDSPCINPDDFSTNAQHEIIGKTFREAILFVKI